MLWTLYRLVTPLDFLASCIGTLFGEHCGEGRGGLCPSKRRVLYGGMKWELTWNGGMKWELNQEVVGAAVFVPGC
jgi:hypothetical protein